MTWYRISVWFGKPGEPYRPVPKYTIAAPSEAEARRLTRVRRFRYYPVRVTDGRIEVAIPPASAGEGVEEIS